MKWKNLYLWKKFAIGFGLILFLLSIVSGWSLIGIIEIVDDAEQVIHGNQLDGNLAQKEIDHLNWANQVNALLVDDAVTELHVQTDHHKCGFGKWLYGEGRKHAEELVPSLAPMLKAIEVPHQNLHKSAIAIEKVYRQADIGLPSLILARQIDHLKWAAKVRDVFLKGGRQLHVETDASLCGLGKWLDTDAARKAYNNGNKTFKNAWDAMIKSHNALHSSAIQVQEALDNSPQQAQTIFETISMPLLEDTIKQLNILEHEARQDLVGMQKASNVFANQARPALKEVQHYLSEIRTEARKNIMTDKEMISAAMHTRFGVIVFSIVAIMVGIALAIIITKGIVGPLVRGIDFAKAIAGGDLTGTIDIKQEDEIGMLAVALNNMTKSLRDMFKQIRQGVETLSSSSSELSAISDQMSATSEQTSGKANSVATASEEMSANMTNVAAAMEQSATNTNMVATASEEMSSTIDEIAQNAEKARGISDEAANKAANASTNMEQLRTAANSIGKVIETITDISEQVNLLALNATIEAARAGEAGKGFAVVANEIKELAKMTAEATQDIKEKIEGIQGSTSTTVGQINEITKVINDVNGVVASIATAVEQQSAATREIATNVAQASEGIREVNENVNQSSAVSNEISQDIAGVNVSMNEMSSSSSQVNLSALELSKLAEKLKQMVNHFKI